MSCHLIPALWTVAFLLKIRYPIRSYSLCDYRHNNFGYLYASMSHVDLLHLFCNMFSWYRFCYIFSCTPELITLQLLGGVFGIFLQNYNNKINRCMGGSGGLFSLMMFYGLKYMDDFIGLFIPIMIVPVWKWLPVYQLTVLTVGLDFVGDYLKHNLDDSKKIPEKSKWWLKNFNTFRYGNNNIGKWGHLGGLLVGVAGYAVYRLWK